MAAANINVRIKGELQAHLQQQIGEHGLYDNASEYIRFLIRNDLKRKGESWAWLQRKLEPALRAGEDSFVAVTAEDVIRRNK